MRMIRFSLMLAFAAFAFGVASNAAGRRRLIDATLRARSKRAFFSPRGRIRRGRALQPGVLQTTRQCSSNARLLSSLPTADALQRLGRRVGRKAVELLTRIRGKQKTSAISWQNWKSMLYHWLAAERARSEKAMGVTHALDRFRTQPRTRAGKGNEFFYLNRPQPIEKS
jgi:hypothetical protein